MPIERRHFLASAGLGGVAAAASAFPMPAIAQERREWRMVTSWPKGLPGVGTGAERLAQRITDMSGGRLTVHVYAAGELVPALQCFDAVADGTAEMAHDAPYYYPGKSEGTSFFTTFPFGFTADEISAWINYGGGQELWDELYAGFGLKGFMAGNTGTQMLGWFKREINSVADFQGLKFRTPGNQAKILTKLGATVVLLPGGEIFAALQSGALDGADWIGPYNDLALGLYQVAPYYYSPGFQEGGAALELTVNKAAYDDLPTDLQAIVRVAAQAGHDDILAEYNARSGSALRTLVQEHGAQLRSLPEEVLIACGNAANEVLNELLDANDPMTTRIIESFLAFRGEVMPWTRVGEHAFLNARMLPYAFGTRS